MATKKEKETVDNKSAEETKAENQAEPAKKPQSKRSSSKKKKVIEVKAKEPAVDEKKKTTSKTAKSTAKKTTTKTTSKKPAVKAEKAPKTEIKKEATEAGNPDEAAAKKEAAPKAQQTQTEKPDRGALILGGGLLFIGVLLLSGRLLGVPFGMFLWPFIFIVPGALIFLTALSTESSSGEGLSILGGILTMLGCVFLAQSTTGMWASWAYAWSLIAPTSIGISQVVYGTRKGRDAIVQSGNRLVKIGLTIFTIGFAFFELVLGVSGFGLARLGLPVFPMMLILAGLVIVIHSYARSRR